MRYLVACDSFKGSLSSKEVGKTIKDALNDIGHESIVLEVSDGGEGALQAVTCMQGFETIICETYNALQERIQAAFLYNSTTQRAIVEFAQAAGLTQIQEHKRSIMESSSIGVGVLIKNALERGAKEIILFLGGSATNDLGMGIASSLGIRFLDKLGIELDPIASNMIHVETIDLTHIFPLSLSAKFLLATDVTNTLLGLSGAAHVYAKQKGASNNQIELLENGAERLTFLIEKITQRSVAKCIGTGAAGGAAIPFLAFLNAEVMSGAQIILDIQEFDTLLTNCDGVITGEGRVDRQTLHGKLPYVIAQRASQQNKGTTVIAGQVCDKEQLIEGGFERVQSIHSIIENLTTAMQPNVTRNAIRSTIYELYG